MYASHGQILKERRDVFEAVCNAYDEAIKESAEKFEQSFLDALNAVFADIPSFFRKAKVPWSASVRTVDPEKEEENLSLVSAEGGGEIILCEKKNADAEGICMSVGRNESNMFVLRNVSTDLRVSGNHFAISFADKTWGIIDRSSNGTFVNRVRLTKGAVTRLYPGDSVCLLNPAMAAEFHANKSNVGMVMTYNVEFRENRELAKKKNISRVLREMNREPKVGRKNELFDPFQLEERLPEVVDMVIEGFEDLRRWVADQVPLFTEAFFTKPLESSIMESMAKIEIEREAYLPVIDGRIGTLQHAERKIVDMLETLHER